VSPRFPIELWNLHDRVKLDLPKTNNNVGSDLLLFTGSQIKSISSKVKKQEGKIKRQVID
jgi:hypothetical protein